MNCAGSGGSRHPTWDSAPVQADVGPGQHLVKQIDLSFARHSGAERAEPKTFDVIAAAVDELSPWHRHYPEGGGFIIGDGVLNHGLEIAGDPLLRVAAERNPVAGDYQSIITPRTTETAAPIQVFSE